MLFSSSHALCFTVLDLNILSFEYALGQPNNIMVSELSSDNAFYSSSYEEYFSIYELSKRTCYRIFGYPLFSDDQREILLTLFYYGYLSLLCGTYLYYFVMMTLPYLGFTKWEGSLHPRFFTLVLVFGILSVLFVIFLDSLDKFFWLGRIYYVLMELNPNDLNAEERFFNVVFHTLLYPFLFWLVKKYTQHILHNDRKRLIGKVLLIYIFVDALVYLYILLSNQLPPGFF